MEPGQVPLYRQKSELQIARHAVSINERRWFYRQTRSSRHSPGKTSRNCPSIRIKLQPGEGLAAWPQLALLGGDTLDGSEPEILLRILPRK